MAKVTKKSAWEKGDIMLDIKKALRLATDAFDANLALLIFAAVEDLRLAGIVISTKEVDEIKNPLIRLAIITYCKAFFEFTDDSKAKEAYDGLKNQLRLGGEAVADV